MANLLPTEPGVYEDRVGDLWVLQEGGKWQYTARRLPFGGVTRNGTHDHLIDAKAMEAIAPYPESELLPMKRVSVADLPPLT